MKILLVNDDGIKAEGLKAIAKELSLKHEVFIVAPMTEQSGMSQALTMGVPLRVETVDMKMKNVTAYAVEGTPADCTKLGTDVLYSGTVGAALEGYNHKISSIALSVSSKSNVSFSTIAKVMADRISFFYNTDKLFMYNINFPKSLKDNKIKFVFTKHGRRIYENEFDAVILDDGSIAYKMQGRAKDIGNDEFTDIEVVKNGYISVTPLQIERTDFSKFRRNS